MNAVEVVLRIVDVFDTNHIGYMAVGSFSVNMYAEPRSTKDADFVIELNQTPIERIVEALASDFDFERQMTFESITLTSRYKLKHRETLFTIELFGLSDEPFDRERFRRRLTGVVRGKTVSVPTMEDVIVQKLRWAARGNRRKDLDDARNVVAANASLLDVPYIRRWCDLHGTRQTFDQLYTEAVALDEPSP